MNQSTNNNFDKIWFDGKVVPMSEGKLPILTHGLHYGSAVFEGIRAYGGKIFKLEEHCERLNQSAELINLPINYSVAEIIKATADLLEESKLSEAYIRPIMYMGSETLRLNAQDNSSHLAIALWVWPSYYSHTEKMKGLRLKIANWRRPAPDTAPWRSKCTGLYVISTLASHEAMALGFDDALMLDWRGLIAEGTGANIFFVIDGKIHTPTPDCFLDGITRRTVIDIANKNNFEVIERHIHPSELKNVTEAFLSGTAAEIMPIGSIDDCKFAPGQICEKMIHEYSELTGAKVVSDQH